MSCFKLFRSAVCAVLCLLGVNTASATLQDRGPDLVYDDVLNITWTRNANLPGSSVTWAQANTWAANLVYAGYDDWRLPYASVSAGAGPITTLTFGQPCTGDGGADAVACRNNEMAYMYYYNLDGGFGGAETGTQIAIGGQVLTGIRNNYWSGTEFDSNAAWNLFFTGGFQGFGYPGLFHKSNQLSAWAVRPGDVAAAVPEPETYGMLLAGLGVIGLAARRRKQKEAATA